MSGLSVSFFNILLHLSTCWLSKSKSFSITLFPFTDLVNSWDINFIVDKGVAKECAEAAAWPPRDTSSCSFAINCWILLNASFLKLDSWPKVIAKKLRKISAIIKAKGTE